MMRAMAVKCINKYNRLSKEVRASFWFLVCAFFQRGISFITTPVFTRLMTTAEYGEFGVFYSWFSIVSIITTLNLFYGVYVRGLVVFDDRKQQFTSSMQALMLTLVVVWTCIYLIFRSYINSLLRLSTWKMVCMLIIIWTNGVFSFWAAEQRVDVEYRKLTIVSAITVLLLPIVQIALMQFMSDKVNARIVGMVLVNILFYPMLFIKHMLKGKVFFSKAVWKYALVFNIPLVPHYLSQSILNSADRIMIERMIGTGEAGIYNLAYSISQIMTVFNSALMQALEPWLYKKIKNNEVESIKRIAYPAFLLIAIVNLLLIALAPELVGIFAPKEYTNAIWVIPPVALSVYFSFLYTFFAVFEFYYKKTKYITVATMAGALLNIVLNYCFIRLYGYYAAGYTTLACFILYAVFHYVFMQRLIKENLNNAVVYEPKALLFISLACLACGGVLLMTYNHPIIRYGFVICILGVAIANYKNIRLFILRIIENRKA